MTVIPSANTEATAAWGGVCVAGGEVHPDGGCDINVREESKKEGRIQSLGWHVGVSLNGGAPKTPQNHHF